MSTLWKIIITTILISSGSLIGVITVAINKKVLNKILLSLVSLSAGTLMGGAMLHLLPEAVEELGSTIPFQVALISFIAFFVIEKVLHWHHCHDENCKEHDEHLFGYLNLVGDAFHNFLDGLIIAATFITNPAIGVATAVAIAMHEIPQEIGDFGVLLHSGFSRTKAIIYNVAVSLTSVLGGIVGFLAIQSVDQIISYLLPVAAGGFLYISASDLMPELRKENNTTKVLWSFATFILGILIMFLLKD